MTPGDAILIQMVEGHRMLEIVMGDVTLEMLRWTPPGTALPIGSIYAHAVGLEDLYVQQILQNKPMIWESEQWVAKLEHDVAPNQWNLRRLVPLDSGVFDEYKQAVFERSRAYVRGLGADDLDRSMQFPGRAWSMSVAQLLAVTIAHTTSHAGEIAILKGIQGARGLPVLAHRFKSNQTIDRPSYCPQLYRMPPSHEATKDCTIKPFVPSCLGG